MSLTIEQIRKDVTDIQIQKLEEAVSALESALDYRDSEIESLRNASRSLDSQSAAEFSDIKEIRQELNRLSEPESVQIMIPLVKLIRAAFPGTSVVTAKKMADDIVSNIKGS
jgi:ribosomal protein L7/L12